MMVVFRTKPLIVVTCVFLSIGVGCSTKPDKTLTLEPWPEKGEVIQTLRAFDNPESAVFSFPDGGFVFISNAADLGQPEKGLHLVEKAGYISKLQVLPDGTLTMVNEQLVTGLTGPLGMAVCPTGTKSFPMGTIVVGCGASGACEPDGTVITDVNRLDSKLVAFSPDGEVLAEIKMSKGSEFEKISGAPVMLPNGLGFDRNGNLYVADSGNNGGVFEPPMKTSPGVYRIPAASFEALSAGAALPEPLQFIPIPGAPDGVEVFARDGAVHVNTVGSVTDLGDIENGAMYRLTVDDFNNGTLPPPFAKGFGALDGLTFMEDPLGDNFIRLDTEISALNAILMTPSVNESYENSKTMRLDFEPSIDVAGAADLAVRMLRPMHILMVIPIPEWLSENAGGNPVHVVIVRRILDKP